MKEPTGSKQNTTSTTGPYVGNTIIKKSIRILLLHPVSPRGCNEGPFRLETQEFLSGTTIVDEIYCVDAPESIEDSANSKMAVPFVLEKTSLFVELNFKKELWPTMPWLLF